MQSFLVNISHGRTGSSISSRIRRAFAAWCLRSYSCRAAAASLESSARHTSFFSFRATFLRAVSGEGKLYVTADQAAVVTRILEGIYESDRTGKPFYFD